MSIETAFFGSLARDAELKTSKSGKSYLRMNVRVENGETAQFISVMAFDQDAIDVAAKLVKGSRIYCEGKLKLDEWTGADGAKRSGLSVMSWHARLSQIGNAKPQREHAPPAPGRERAARGLVTGVTSIAPAGQRPDFNDDVPFEPEMR